MISGFGKIISRKKVDFLIKKSSNFLQKKSEKIREKKSKILPKIDVTKMLHSVSTFPTKFILFVVQTHNSTCAIMNWRLTLAVSTAKGNAIANFAGLGSLGQFLLELPQKRNAKIFSLEEITFFANKCALGSKLFGVWIWGAENGRNRPKICHLWVCRLHFWVFSA